MESTFQTAEVEADVETTTPAPAEQPAPAVPALIFLESAGDAGVCGVDGVCD